MARGKKQQQQQQQQQQPSQDGCPPQRGGAGPSSATALSSTTASPHINRTRTKLPTKRQQLRQEAATAAALTNAASSSQPLLEGQLLVVMPRNPSPRFEQRNGGNASRGGMTAGRGAKRFNGHHPSKGFSLREEALNTSDNYYGRSWMDDKKSTLRYQGITFVEGGILSNKLPTPPASESEDESSHALVSGNVPAIDTSNETEDAEIETPGVDVQVTKMATVDEVQDPSPFPSTPSVHEPADADESTHADLARPHTDSSISIPRAQVIGSSPTSSPPSISNRQVNPSPPTTSTIPLPPVQFISSNENIVFTPRSQRNRSAQPTTRRLTNWEVPTSIKDINQTATDWTKPRKKSNRNGGVRQFRYESDSERGQVEYLSPVYGLPMTTTAEDALMDYLENVRGQAADSSGDEKYIDKALEDTNIVTTARLSVVDRISNLSLEDTRRAQSVEPRKKTAGPLLIPSTLARFSLSESARPHAVNSPESPAPANSVVVSDVDSEKIVNRVPPVISTGDTGEDNTWILNSDPNKSESSSESDSEEPQLIGRFHKRDPINEDANNQGSENEQEEDEEEEEPAEDDFDDEEDFNPSDFAITEEDVIANMMLDEYDIDNIGFPQVPKPLAKIAHIHQGDVPPLPEDDADIAGHLQALWQKDRETKKERKKERQLARLQGLLGSKSKSNGKNVRQAARREEMMDTEELEGFVEVNMRQINEELRGFWEADDLTDYALPPMHRLARKAVHELAKAYNLGSKSKGSGTTRYTTLFKLQTTANLPPNERKIATLLRRTSHISALGRTSADANRVASYRLQARSSRLRDGDIVGGDAQEIASDNRGRVMLEKLGWRSGMGLGAEGGGITIPLLAVVKKSKSGLQ